jgi:hypothetical protein
VECEKDTVVTLKMVYTQGVNTKVWKQVPGQLIWQNINSKEYIAIHGGRDQAWYVVKRTVPVAREGTVYGITISPYFVLPLAPIGQVGRASNANIKENEDWQPGLFEDALAVAVRYMRNHQT